MPIPRPNKSRPSRESGGVMTAEEMFEELNGFINNDYELQYDFYNEIEHDLIRNQVIDELLELVLIAS